MCAVLHRSGAVIIKCCVYTYTHCTLQEETTVGVHTAVTPSVAGCAWITQYCDVIVHPSDPFPTGYTVGDIWAA